MSKNIEHQYLKLLKDTLDNGVTKQTRNGGTISVFGRQIRHDMKLGFPLLTTKKMPFRTIATELIWFLRGDTNIKFLVDNGCHIWDGDAYKNYETSVKASIDKATQEGILKNDESEEYIYLSKESFIERIKTDDEFAKKWGELGPVYGKQWRSWYTRELMFRSDVVGEPQSLPEFFEVKVPIDQIANLINDLKTNPDSRRLMVNSWNVGQLDEMVLPPCHYGFQVYTRELSFNQRYKIGNYQPYNTERKVEYGEGLAYITQEQFESYHHKEMDILNIPTRSISLMWNQRSVDTFLGLPFNIASYGLLLEIIAKAVNMVPDELIGNLGDVHLYSNHIEQAKEQLTREPYLLPKFNINTEWWPYEGGECGIGPIDAVKVFESFKDENFCRCLLEEDLQLYDYQSHPTIKAPLSN